MRPRFRFGFIVPGARVALFVALASSGCRKPEEDADLLPPPGLAPSAMSPIVTSPMGALHFGQGWYPVESNAEGSWRWMGQVGEIRVPTLRTKALLQIVGWAPLELLGTAPTMRVSVNGREVDHFVPPMGHFKKEYRVPIDIQGEDQESAVRLETSATASAPGDPRDLGYALVSISWANAP